MKQDRNGVRTPQDLERKYNCSSLKKAVEQSETGLTKINQELDKFVNKTTSNIEELQKQLDGKVTTYYYSGEPSFSSLPTSEWEESEYSQYLGDLYYDKETGYVYMFQEEDGVYSWKHIIDKDLTSALALANAAKDTADNKRRVFVTQPAPPYDNGDLWLNDKEIYVCQISKAKDEVYDENDFIIATKYTDDTLANQVNGELTVVKGQVTVIQEKQNEFDVTVTEHTSMINSLNEETTELGSDVADLKITSQSITETVSKQTNDISKLDSNTQSIQETVNKTTLDIEGFKISLQTLSGTIQSMNFNFKTDGLEVAKENDETNSKLDNKGIRVFNYSELKAVFNNNGSGIDKLIVTGTAQIGYLKIVKGTRNNKKVTQLFHLNNLIEDLQDLVGDE